MARGQHAEHDPSRKVGRETFIQPGTLFRPHLPGYGKSVSEAIKLNANSPGSKWYKGEANG